MTSLVAPRFEIPIDDKGNRISREWYKFLVQLGNSNGTSLTSTQDVQIFQNQDSAGVEALIFSALNRLSVIDGQFLLSQDSAQKADNDLMAFWPGNAI